jgi:hypothetical protein
LIYDVFLTVFRLQLATCKESYDFFKNKNGMNSKEFIAWLCCVVKFKFGDFHAQKKEKLIYFVKSAHFLWDEVFYSIKYNLAIKNFDTCNFSKKKRKKKRTKNEICAKLKTTDTD